MRQLFLQGIELFNTCIDLLDACFGLTLLFCEFLLALIKFCLAGRNLSPGIKDLILVRILLAQQFFLGLLQFRFSVGNLASWIRFLESSSCCSASAIEVS